MIFVDTVGFVRKLPTSLVASFRSTLSEIQEADLVLHVVDASSPRSDEEERVATETFEELGVASDRVLTVWNKADVSGVGGRFGGLRISGLTGVGIDRLEQEIRRRLAPESEEFRVRIPYTSAKAIAAARAAFRVVDEEDRGDSLWMRLAGERKNLRPLARFVEA